MTAADLPAVNATLNAISTILLVAGWLFIRSGNKRGHIACMVSALITSAAFLTCYLIYHSLMGSKPFPVEYPTARKIYFVILIPHIILAIVNLPMIIMTVVPAIRQRFDRHQRIARWTLPVWLFVSVTGVLVYLMLYQWFPAPTP